MDFYCRWYRFHCRISYIIDTFTQEGAATIAIGLLVSYFVPASPRTIKLLTEEEREAYCRDLAGDWSGDADADGKYKEEFSWNQVTGVFTDAPHVLMLAAPLFFSRLMVSCLCSSLAQIMVNMHRLYCRLMVSQTCIASRFPSQFGRMD
jgi:hypothetical protein